MEKLMQVCLKGGVTENKGISDIPKISLLCMWRKL